VRFQRSAQGLLDRFADLTTAPDRFTELAPFVVPVVMIGTDETDAERRRFMQGAEGTAAAGFVPRVVIAARTGPIQLLDLAVRRPGSAAVVDVQLRPDEGFGTPPSGSNGVAFSSTILAGSLGFIRGPADETLWLPVRGFILPVGLELEVRNEQDGSTLSWWASWRNVGEFVP